GLGVLTEVPMIVWPSFRACFRLRIGSAPYIPQNTIQLCRIVLFHLAQKPLKRPRSPVESHPTVQPVQKALIARPDAGMNAVHIGDHRPVILAREYSTLRV